MNVHLLPECHTLSCGCWSRQCPDRLAATARLGAVIHRHVHTRLARLCLRVLHCDARAKPRRGHGNNGDGDDLGHDGAGQLCDTIHGVPPDGGLGDAAGFPGQRRILLLVDNRYRFGWVTRASPPITGLHWCNNHARTVCHAARWLCWGRIEERCCSSCAWWRCCSSRSSEACWLKCGCMNASPPNQEWCPERCCWVR